MQVNNVYQFEGFKLRPCNTNYNNLGSMYEIEITKSTTIDHLSVNNQKICPIVTNFVNLMDIDEIAAGQCIGKNCIIILKTIKLNITYYFFRCHWIYYSN